MKLFGHPDSAHAFKVKFFLDHVSIPHDYETVDIYCDVNDRDNIFLQASRLAEVPVLIDEGNNLTQSNAILMYLADKNDFFGSSKDRQVCCEWLFWEANKIGMCLPQLRCHDYLSLKHSKFTLEKGAYNWLLSRYNDDVSVLDRELGYKKFIVGDTVSPADFSLSAYLLYAYEYNDEIGITIPSNVVRWLDRLKQLRGWQKPYQMLQ